MSKAMLLQDFIREKEKAWFLDLPLMGISHGVAANVGMEKHRRPNLTGNGDPEEKYWRAAAAVLATLVHAFCAQLALHEQ